MLVALIFILLVAIVAFASDAADLDVSCFERSGSMVINFQFFLFLLIGKKSVNAAAPMGYFPSPRQ